MSPVVQLFDNKADTLQFYTAFLGLYNFLATERVKFWDDAYYAYALADYLYGKVPASIAMPIDEWRKSFNHTIQAFNLSGTAETYLTMLRALFGINTVITFTVTAPAVLEIEIDVSGNTSGIEEDFFIDDLAEEIVTDENENIIFIKVLGQLSNADLQAVLQATVPVGISVTFTIIN